MANPYYIKRQRSPLIDYAQLGLQLYGLKQRGEIAKGQQDVDMKRLALEETKTRAEYGTPDPATPGGGTGLTERRVGVAESATRLSEQKFQAQQRQIEASLKPVTPGQFAAIEAALPQLNDSLGFSFDKAATGYVNTLKNLTEQGMVRRDLYDYSVNNWDEIKKPLTEAAQKEMERAVKDKDAGKVKQLTQTIDAMDDPRFIDQFYPSSARLAKKEAEEATTKRLAATKTPAKSIGLIEQEAAARARGTASVAKLKKPTEAEKDAPLNVFDDVRSVITRKAKGGTFEIVDTPSEAEINALKKTAKARGHDIEVFNAPEIDVPWDTDDIPARKIVIPIPEGQQIGKSFLVDYLMNVYAYSNEAASKIVDGWIEKGL